MRKVRNKVFETNSSSTHTISIITKKRSPSLPQHINFYLGQFNYGKYTGKAKNNFEQMASYLYCTILQLDEDEDKNRVAYYLAKLSNLLTKNNITFTYELYELPKEYRFYPTFIRDDCFEINTQSVLKSLDNINDLTTFLMESELVFNYETY